MRALHTFCVVLLSVSMTIAPAFSFGLKKKKDLPPTLPTQASDEGKKDVSKDLDALLKEPVKARTTDIQPQALEPTPEPKPAAEPAAAAPAARPENKLQGTIEAIDLTGDSKANALQGNADADSKPQTVLKGGASVSAGKLGVEDPDLADRELMVEWDRWRNRFLRAVQLQVQAGVNHPDEWEEQAPRARVIVDPYTGHTTIQPPFPMGTEAWFTCEVTADKRINKLSIIRPSGHPAYDKAVLEGVRALEGTSLLNYPNGSHRLKVTQTAGIRTATSSDFQYHHFGDVERVRGQ